MNRRTRGMLLVGLLAASLGIGGAASAAVKYVDISVTATGDTKDGSTWANAYTNLWDAMAACAAGTEYWVAQGTYTPTNLTPVNGTAASIMVSAILEANDVLYGGFPSGGGAFGSRDWKTYPTYISGSKADDGTTDINVAPLFEVANLGTSPTMYVNTTLLLSSAAGVKVDGFTLQYGNNISTHTRYGSALYMYGGDATLRNCVIRYNGALRGAIAIKAASCYMENCLLYGNFSYTNQSAPAAFYTDTAGTVAITNCTFVDNNSTTNQANDVRFHSAMTGPVHLQNCIFAGSLVNTCKPIYTNSIGGGNANANSRTNNCFIIEDLAKGTGNTSGDPNFLNRAGKDYHLLSGPCVDSGDSSGGVASKDLDFATRVVGTIDMGCYEKVASAKADLTVNDSPNGGAFTVSVVRGGTYNGNVTDFTLTDLDQGSMTMTATSPKSISGDERYIFAKWNDGSTDYTANPLSSYDLNGTKTFTLTFDQQFRATNSVEGTGTLSMSPANGWTNAGATVTYSNPQAGGGFNFLHWKEATGDSPISSATTLNVTLTCPTNIVAVFQASGTLVQVLSSPAEAGYMADGDTWYETHSYSWADGYSAYLAVTSPAVVSSTKEYRFVNWNDNDVYGPVTTTNWSYPVGASPVTVTASFDTYYKLTTAASNGTITNDPASADGFYKDGTVVYLYAEQSTANYGFSSWSGDASGSANPVAVTMSSAKSVTASFTQIAYVDRAATAGLKNGTSWADAYTNLWEALAAEPAGRQYRIAAGTYTPTNWVLTSANSPRGVIDAGDVLLGGFPVGGGTLAQRDWKNNPTYISGDRDGDGVSDIVPENATIQLDAPLLYTTGAGVVLDGFTLQFGNNAGTHTRWGGALYINGGDTTMRNCIIRHNFAERGAGIAVKSSKLSAENCLFYGNTNIASYGAGIYTDGATGLGLTNCTFVSNYGAGLGADDVRIAGNLTGPFVIYNSIFWSSSGSLSTNDNNNGGTLSHSDVRGWATAVSPNINSDPMFLDEAGGNYRLLGSSPCLNAGNSAVAAAKDLDNTDRIKGAAVDMGAYEKTDVPLANLTVNDSPDGAAFEVVVQDVVTWTRNTDFTLSSLDQGSIVLTATSPQTIDATSRYAFQKWNDGTSDYFDNPCNGGAYNLNGNKTITLTYKTQYLVAAESSPVGSCSGFTLSPADGWVDSGSSVQVTATGITSGYALSDWLLNGVSQGASDNPHTFPSITGPATLTAVFVCSGSSVTVGAAPDGRTYTADGDGPRSGDKSYCWTASSSKTLTTTDNQDAGDTQYRFVNWTDGLGWSDSGLSATYTVPGADTVVQANFNTYHKLTVTPPSGGSLSYSPALPGDSYYASGQAVTVTAVPDPGYSLAAWSGTAADSAVVNGNDLIFTMNEPKTLAVSFAQALRVDKDSVAGAPDGSTWANAYQTLQAALTVATSGQEIWVADGTYVPGTLTSHRYELKGGVAVYGGFNATEAARPERNWNNNVTTLSGDLSANDTPGWGNRTDNANHVVYVLNNTPANFRLDGFTIRSGDSTSLGSGGHGAGMYIGTGTVGVVANCVFTDNRANTANAYGGGLYPDHVIDVRVENCVFNANRAYFGGGLACVQGSATTEPCGFSLVNSTVVSNSATTRGGGVYNQYIGTPGWYFRNNVIWSNQLDSGVASDLWLRETYTRLANNNYGLTTEGGVYYVVLTGNLANQDPLLADIPSGDFRLTASSPGKDTGTSSGAPAADIEGRPRPTGAGFDMGAYEFGSSYTLTYNAGAGGSIVGNALQTVPGGADGSAVTATPNPNYFFVGWSDAYPTAVRQELNVSGNLNVTATFDSTSSTSTTSTTTTSSTTSTSTTSTTTTSSTSTSSTTTSTTSSTTTTGVLIVPQTLIRFD